MSHYHQYPDEVLPELNLQLLLDVFYEVENDPDSFNYDWHHCFAGRTINRTGGRWFENSNLSLLHPTEDDDTDYIREYTWMRDENENAETRFISAGDRARRLLGLTEDESRALFINVNPDVDDDVAAEYRSVIVNILEDRGVDPAVIDQRRPSMSDTPDAV